MRADFLLRLVCSFLSFALGAIADIAELPRPFDKAPLGALTLLGRERRIDQSINMLLSKLRTARFTAPRRR